MTPPVDNLALSKSTDEIINEKLYNDYKISSDIKDPALCASVFEAVKDFCGVNQNNSLFEGLKITQKPIDRIFEGDIKDNEYTLVFQINRDYKKLSEHTKSLYDEGLITSDNPLYQIYRALGDYLNFSYNPYAHKVIKGGVLEGKSAACAYQLSDNTDANSFNTHFIAAKMSGSPLPKDFYDYFIENSGNPELVFPDNPFVFDLNNRINPENEKEVIEKLKEIGIEAEFPTFEAGKEFLNAAYELIDAVGDKTIFEGLKVTIPDNRYNTTLTQASINYDSNKPKEANITINPAFDWKRVKTLQQKYYDCGFRATPRVKDIFIHELAHYLDFQGNPESYGRTDYFFKSGRMRFNNDDRIIASKVSQYATMCPSEFCAEYLAGKAAGLKYSEAVDDFFKNCWHGPKINFP